VDSGRDELRPGSNRHVAQTPGRMPVLMHGSVPVLMPVLCDPTTDVRRISGSRCASHGLEVVGSGPRPLAFDATHRLGGGARMARVSPSLNSTVGVVSAASTGAASVQCPHVKGPFRSWKGPCCERACCQRGRVPVAQAQVRADAERATVRYQEPPARFSAARIRKKAAHP
jgi:hypothetical protein